MENLTYAETVIEQVHMKTFRGGLKWRCNRDSVSADPTTAINVSFKFDDDGPDSAIWEYVMITHPVGKDMTMIGNPASPKARFCQIIASGRTLDQANEIFRHILLEPRKKEFEAAMKALQA